MADRTIFIRSDPLRVVVKPHPGAGQTVGNRFGFKTVKEAKAYAAEMSDTTGYPVVDER